MHDRPPITLSVLLTARDQPQQLERCLAALAAAPLRFVELVVIDDGSDPAAEIDATRLRLPITLMRNKRRRGDAAARNTAAAVALGDILIFLATDTCVAPDTIGAIERAFAADPLLGVLLGPTRGRELDPSEAPLHVFQCGLFAIREWVFREHGGFLERNPATGLADRSANGGSLELLLRLAHSGVRMMARDTAAVAAQATPALRSTLRSCYRHGITWERLRESRRGLEQSLPWWALRDARLEPDPPRNWWNAWKCELRQHLAEMAFHAGTSTIRLREFAQATTRPLRRPLIGPAYDKRQMRNPLLRSFR